MCFYLVLQFRIIVSEETRVGMLQLCQFLPEWDERRSKTVNIRILQQKSNTTTAFHYNENPEVRKKSFS